MPRTKEDGFAGRMKWLRESYGMPWLYATTGHNSMRQFAIALGLNSPTYINWEVHGRTPDRRKLADLATKLGMPDPEGAAVWLLTGHGALPVPPAGITPKRIPLPAAEPGAPVQGRPATTPAQPLPVPATSQAPAMPQPVLGTDPIDLQLLRDLATEIALEAAGTGEKLPPRVLELIRAVRNMGVTGKRALSALILGACLAVGADGAQQSDTPDRSSRMPADDKPRRRKKKVHFALAPLASA